MTGRPFVALRITDDTETPVGTLWCEDWGDAIATARLMYEGPLLIRASHEASSLWLDAYDAEAKATHAENENIRRFALIGRTHKRVMTKIEKLFPFLYRDE